MRKTLKVIGFSMMMVFLLSVGVAAEGNGSGSLKKPAIKVTKASGTIRIDGKATEASWKKAPNLYKTMNTEIITATTKTTTKFPANSAKITTLKYLWDAKAIYVFMTVADKTSSVNAIEAYNQDSIEYHIDVKNCKRTAYNGKCEGQYRMNRKAAVSGWGYFNRAGFVSSAKSINGSSSYTQEVKIRFDWHGVSSLKKGAKIGFDIQVNDAINNVRTYQIVWNSLDNAWSNPSTMGTLIFN